MTHVCGPSIVSGPVSGRPFTAKIEARRERTFWFGVSRTTLNGSIARDRTGRVRVEYSAKGRVLSYSVADHVTGVIRIVDTVHKTMTDMPYADQTFCASMQTPPNAEKKLIEGRECFRMVVPDVVDEAWVCSRLQHVVLECSIRGSSRFIWRMYNISTYDPDPELFKLPSDSTQSASA